MFGQHLLVEREPTKGGERDGALVFKGHRISVGEAKKVLEMNDGDGCTIL